MPPAPLPFGPVPSVRQQAWHALEFYGFLHFTVNTFTDQEWGYGDESAKVFNPTDFDADQIAETAAAGGMAGLILTAKHHDGFCLWQSRWTEHSVRNSPWRNGKGDVVREMAQACARNGLKFGVYLSPWDRNHPAYGTPVYIEYYRRQLRELLTEYGELFEVWFDGANGGDGYYGGSRETRRIDRRTYYGWDETWQMVRDLQPGACIFSDAGPDVRWVGNEQGIAGDPCWHTLNRTRFCPGESDAAVLNQGERTGSDWLPAECDVSIRPGWFYHPAEDEQVRSPQNLLDLYFQSVGRGASLLLNLPPDRRGQIHPADVRSLLAFRRLRERLFWQNLAAGAEASASSLWCGLEAFSPAQVLDRNPHTCWAAGEGDTLASLELRFPAPRRFNIVALREYLPLGQRVEAFAVDALLEGGWSEIGQATSIGNLRLLRTPTVQSMGLRLRVTAAPVPPAIREVCLYWDETAGKA